MRRLGEPLVSSTLLLPGQDAPMTQGWQIKDTLDHVLDAVVDSGDCGASRPPSSTSPTETAVITRVGAGDPQRFAALVA